MREEGGLGFREILRMPEIRASVLGTFVIMLGFGILSPVLPNYARSFGVGYGAIGVLISSFSLARLISDPFVGSFIDRHGERAMATLGAVVVGVTSIAAGLAPTFALLVLFRSVGGAGSALFFAAILSFLLRTIPPDRTGRVMSVYYASFNVGFIAGGPLGGVIAHAFGLASPLHVYGVSCFLAAGVFWRTIRNPERHVSEVRRGGVRRLPWGRPLVAVLASNLAYMWIIAAVYSTLVPLFGKVEAGLSLSGIGLGLAIATATETFALFPAGRASDRYGRRAVLLPALILFAGVTMLFGLAASPVTFMVALGALGLGSGFSGVPPAPMLADVTPEDLKGSAVAVFRFVGDVGFVFGPLIAGWVAGSFGFGAAFAISAVPCLVAFALVLSIRETMSMLPRSGEAAGL